MRLDQLLVKKGLFPSRERARRAVLAGDVEIEGRPATKPATAVSQTAEFSVRDSCQPFVSRGGLKLAAALDFFAIDPQDQTCFDVGASTGGFTDCLLERGARRVYAVDVGHAQLAPKLRQDPRVKSWEGVNARYLAEDFLPEPCDLVVADLSFISILKVAPALLPHIKEGGIFLPLLKPQFEVGPHGVGKGGIVREEDVRRAILKERYRQLADLGFLGLGMFDCPVAGSDGNREALVALRRGGSL